MNSVLIVGTGLIGASVGLALKAAGCTAQIVGFDPSGHELEVALTRGAADSVVRSRVAALEAAPHVDLVLLATPVLAVLDWMRLLVPVLGEHQLITDVGSTKLQIARAAIELYNQPGRASFLPGHPMAGKESGGAELAEARLFQNAMWLLTPIERLAPSDPLAHLRGGVPDLSGRAVNLEAEWRTWIGLMGARTRDLDPAHHDELCALVSHLPQMLSTALAALLEERCGADEQMRAEIAAIGGRALRETTRLGASPYSMWRDVALTNTEPIAETLHALEQVLAHLRENLRTPELRALFNEANRFREH
jgi:prephenate dehydrogenase